MKKIIYACPWATNKKKSWSGTHYSLYTHLKQFYEVEDYETSCIRVTKCNIALFRIVNKIVKILKLKKKDMELIRYKLVNFNANKDIKDNSIPIIQFESCPMVYKNPCYIYIDLHVGYITKMYHEMHDIFLSSNYAELEEAAILKREELQKNYFMHCTGIFTMGKWLAKELVEEYQIPAEKVHHIGGGCNIDVKKIDDSQKSYNKILFVGRDFERKNGPLVVEAFKILRKKNPRVELYIAGPDRLNIQAEGVTMLGDLSSDDLIQYYNMCDIFCMPSKFEAYGLVFVEALAFGLPCIGRDAFEMPYFIQDNETGYLLKDENVFELSELMDKLLINERIRKNVKEKRSWYIQEYSWNNAARRIMEVVGS